MRLGGIIDLQGPVTAQYARIPFATQTTSLLPPGTDHELDYLLLSDVWPTAWTCLDFAIFKPGDNVAVFGAGTVFRIRV